MDKSKAQSHIERPPVICIMGHIDHGKSTLLDYIRKTNIAEEETGGITQKISAYEVIHNGKKITFLDTPGHESFAKIRERGANVADIAVLVVSAEDGVKKQTIEALKCITASNTPYIVAINKIDKPNADIERTKINLAENEIYLEGYGGNIPFAPISAKTGQGVNELLNLMLLVAEVEELKGDTSLPAEGIVIEANMDKQKGISATMVIKNGTIKNGQFVACGKATTPVRIMENFLGKKITEACFSSPIRLIGFSELPKVGQSFKTFDTKEEALAAAQNYKEIKTKDVCPTDSAEMADGIGMINVVIKADVIGSIEGIEHELEKIKNERMKVKIVKTGVGDISENDVNLLAGKPDSIVLGFNVRADAKARAAAERVGIEIKHFDIIYKLAEWLVEFSLSKTPKIQVEEMTAKIKVLKNFSQTKDKYVIGGRVEEGELKSGDDVKIMRREIEIGRGKIRELQQAKEKTSEVRTGVEFGCMLQANIAPAPGDKLEAFKIVTK